jgi:hypothetical protein
MPYFGIKMLLEAAEKEKALVHLKLGLTRNTSKNPAMKC